MIASSDIEIKIPTSIKKNNNSDIKTKKELLPLCVLPENITQPTSPILNSPCIATKNNILKLKWWHSTTQPLEYEAFLDSSQIADGIDRSNLDQFKMKTLPKDTKHIQIHQIKSDTTLNKSPVRDENSVHSLRSSGSHKKPGGEESDDSHLFVNDRKQCIGLLNLNEEDEMKICGYRRSLSRTLVCWLCICVSVGMFRLVLHWWRHWYLIATNTPCPLAEAEYVLIQEDYQGKHKLYHVKKVEILDVCTLRKFVRDEVASDIRSSTSNQSDKFEPDFYDENNLNFSVHFTSAKFKKTKTLRIFNCKQLLYAWNYENNSFLKIQGLDKDVPCSYYQHQKGLNIIEQISRRFVYGPNEITVPYKDVKTLFLLEVLNPFYVFQIFSVILWFAYDYYYYACVILLMSIFGIIMSILQTKKNQDALKKTVINTGNALVVNAIGNVTEVPNRTLVPGDIVEIPRDGCVMQCDAVLLSGNCIIDESMLTGESVPVTKTPLPPKRDLFDKKEHARHVIFCGTKVIQTRYIGSKKVLAFVLNTGNITAKGELIRSILYPPPVDYKFEQDSYKFIQCLAVIACIGFIYTLFTKILRGTDPIKIAVESLDLITIVVPPALPAAMTVGRFYAQKRLQEMEIYCISPRAINVAGSIDCCCFDKTGTLTEDGLDMWGVVPKSSTNQFQIPIRQVERLPYDHFLFGMTTCHSITIMNGKMMGDPLDMKMFESTGWILEDSKNIPENEKYGLIYPTILRQPNKINKPNSTSKIIERQSSVDDLLASVGLSNCETHYDHGIVREFPFSSSLQRMSVITKCLSKPGFNVYCKGSPEMLQQLCNPKSIPENYTQQLSIFAKKGYRIIAMAFKPLHRKLNYTKAQRLSREEVEHDLEFLGFVILENRLKADTTEVIDSLNVANIRTIMVTGDNILTAMSVARDCGIISPIQALITVHTKQNNAISHPSHSELYYTLELGTNNNTSHVLQKCINGNVVLSESSNIHNKILDQNNIFNGDTISSRSYESNSLPNSGSFSSVKTCDTWTHNDCDAEIAAPRNVQNNITTNWRSNYRFAMEGKTWQIARDYYPDQMSLFLTRGAIFARMSPEQKQALISELQKLDYCVAMCGDGANDCGALKVAHTGISLSETESSIASPFTSRNPTIASVPNVIKEGRAALVTSFGIFKYMACYSLTQFISVMILYSIDSNLTDKQYLYIDLGLISIFAFFFGKTKSYVGPLAKQVPLSSLISATPLASLILHLVVVILFQISGWFYLRQQSWFEPSKLYENYTIFVISGFQYIFLAIVFSKGAPYRQPIWSNWPFCASLSVNTCIVIYLTVNPIEWIANVLEFIIPPDINFRYAIIIFGLLNFACHIIVETFIVEHFIHKKCQIKWEENIETCKKKYMRLEHELQTYESWPPITEIFEPHNIIYDEKLKPTYVNLSAEQNIEMPKSVVFPGFFELEKPLEDSKRECGSKIIKP